MERRRASLVLPAEVLPQRAQGKDCCAGRPGPGSHNRFAMNLARSRLFALLLVTVFLLYPPFGGVRLFGQACTFATARSTEVDRRIGLIFYRFQRGGRPRPLSGRSRRRGGLDALTLQVLQILGSGSRSRTRCRLADGRAFLRRFFGGGMLNPE